MNRHLLGATALCFLASAAAAQDFNGFETRGQAELEYLREGDSAQTTLNGDFAIDYRSAGSFGFDFALDGNADLENGGFDKALFAAGVLDLGFGELALGAPESTADRIIDRPSAAGMFGIDRTLQTSASSSLHNISKNNDAQSYGVRFEGESGGMRYGTSIHRFVGEGNTLLQFAGEYTTGATEIEGMAETDIDNGDFATLVGVTQNNGQFSVGAYLGRQNIEGVGTSVQVAGDYALNDALKVGASYTHTTAAAGDNFLGVKAEYGFANGGYLQGGIGDSSSSKLLLDASVGFKF